MNIAIASGKGGTGKTTVAVNLAVAMERQGIHCAYADCDVEEPNGHIFLAPQIQRSEPVTLPYPIINTETCISCGLCAEICRYRAIIILDGRPMVFPDMCHSCGGCMLVCPAGSVTEEQRRIGVLETGHRNGMSFVQGVMDIGQVLAPPLIRAVKRALNGDTFNIIDCPPGTSCPVITAMTGASYVILVTEPTPFGLHDLQLAVEAVRELGIPCGVIINRSDIGTGDTRTYCRSKAIPVLGEIPDDQAIARAYSRGELLLDAVPGYHERITRIIQALNKYLRI